MKDIKEIDEKIKNSKISKNANEFKQFISRGNVVDMAVGVIIGTAFAKIISSLVDDVLMPLIGMLLGGLDFSSLSIKLGESTINYGMFIQSIVDFLIIAFCIFMMIKFFERFKKQEELKEEKDPQIKILEEIRDEIKKQK